MAKAGFYIIDIVLWWPPKKGQDLRSSWDEELVQGLGLTRDGVRGKFIRESSHEGLEPDSRWWPVLSPVSLPVPRFHGSHVVSWERNRLLSPHISRRVGRPSAAQHPPHSLCKHVGRVLGQPHLHGKARKAGVSLGCQAMSQLHLLSVLWLEGEEKLQLLQHPLGPGHRQRESHAQNLP